jgi:SAM-dependent methyltransferase
MTELKYADYTRNTSELVKSLAHSRRYTQALKFIAATASDVVLDYGCGDAHLFELLPHVPAQQLIAFDPDPKMLSEIKPELASSILIYSNSTKLVEENRSRCSLIVCMEVCEHLSEKSLDVVVGHFKELAANDARIVIGVPIETGLSGFAKNIYRLFKGNRMGATFGSALITFFGAPVERNFNEFGWTPNHIGFREKDLLAILKKNGFSVNREGCIPLKLTGHFLNNEAYYTCRLPSKPTVAIM